MARLRLSQLLLGSIENRVVFMLHRPSAVYNNVQYIMNSAYVCLMIYETCTTDMDEN